MSIGSSAFAYCSNLTSVTVPDSVTSIGNWAFSFCPSLVNINVYSANLNYKSVDGVLFDKNMTTLIQCPGARSGTFVVPAGVISIESEAFAICASITSVEIPDSMIYIGDFAFANCYGLTSMELPGSITVLGSPLSHTVLV